MHVCLVHRKIDRLVTGGLAVLYRELAKALVASGQRVTLLTQHTDTPVDVAGASVTPLPRVAGIAEHRRNVADALARLEPDVVDCSSWGAEPLTYLPHADRAPVLVRADVSAATMTIGRPDLVVAEKELLHAADMTVAVSGFAARDVARQYGVPVPRVIYNGVDLRRFRTAQVTAPVSGCQVVIDTKGHDTARFGLPGLAASGSLPPPWSPPPAGRRNIVWVGKTVPMKGWDRLQDIILSLSDTARFTLLLLESPVHCDITVDGSGEVTILRHLEEADMPGFYKAADCLLVTSRWEGFGLPILEALAAGTPVLAPADLEVATEFFVFGGGRQYRDLSDLRALVHALDGIEQATLPTTFDWRVNAAVSLEVYRVLTGKT